MPLDVVHWGGRWGPGPSIVATAAWNGMGATPHQIWAWRRAEMNALSESPFLCGNGARAIMAHIRSLPPREKGGQRLRRIGEALISQFQTFLGALTPASKVGLVVGLAERFADGAEPQLRAGRGELLQSLIAPLKDGGLDVVPLLVPRGNAAFALAVLEAGAALAAGQIEAAIVGGLDTYYDPAVVEGLLRSRRLYDGENLDSFIPGEGGAFCLLTRREVATRHKWPLLAQVESVATNEEPGHMGTDLPCLGLGLSRPLRAIADRLQEEKRNIDLWLGDVTNENYRTQEWMLAFPRASAGVSLPGAATQQFLPVLLGDLGAATMATATVLAIESFLRGDLEAANCIVAGSSVGEHRGALFLTAGAAASTPEATASVAARANVPARQSRLAETPSESTSQSLPPEAAPPPPVQAARLGMVAYASACAESMVHPDRAEAAWARFGLSGSGLEAEHAAWREHLTRYPEERREFEQHLQQFASRLRGQ